MCEPSDVVQAKVLTCSSSLTAASDDADTRAEVCEDCDQLAARVPLTCKLVKRQKQAGMLPCPRALRDMLASPFAQCPHPDPQQAQRWQEAILVGTVPDGSSPSLAGTGVSSPPAATRAPMRDARPRQRGFNRKAFYVHPHGPVANPRVEPDPRLLDGRS